VSIVDGCVLRVCSGAKVRSGPLTDGRELAARAWITADGLDYGASLKFVVVGGPDLTPGGRVVASARARGQIRRDGSKAVRWVDGSPAAVDLLPEADGLGVRAQVRRVALLTLSSPRPGG
jgi:hypothetical protein